MGAQREQHRLAAEAGHARGRWFYAYGKELRNVDQFRYLGRKLSEADSDVPAVRRNLKKARGVWRRISAIIAKDSVPATIAGMFFRVVVESVLLYGSETWSLSPTALRCLDGFQVEAARRFTGMLPKKRGDVWVYPRSPRACAPSGSRFCGGAGLSSPPSKAGSSWRNAGRRRGSLGRQRAVTGGSRSSSWTRTRGTPGTLLGAAPGQPGLASPGTTCCVVVSGGSLTRSSRANPFDSEDNAEPCPSRECRQRRWEQDVNSDLTYEAVATRLSEEDAAVV